MSERVPFPCDGHKSQNLFQKHEDLEQPRMDELTHEEDKMHISVVADDAILAELGSDFIFKQ